MGSHLVRSYITERDTTPDPRKPSAYDPHLGFPERKERGDPLSSSFQTLSRAFRPDLVSKHDLRVFSSSSD